MGFGIAGPEQAAAVARIADGVVVGSAVVLLLEHTLSRLATSSGMPASAPVILSYAVYAALLIAATLLLPGGVVSIASSARERFSRRTRRNVA